MKRGKPMKLQPLGRRILWGGERNTATLNLSRGHGERVTYQQNGEGAPSGNNLSEIGDNLPTRIRIIQSISIYLNKSP